MIALMMARGALRLQPPAPWYAPPPVRAPAAARSTWLRGCSRHPRGRRASLPVACHDP